MTQLSSVLNAMWETMAEGREGLWVKLLVMPREFFVRGAGVRIRRL